MRGTEWSALRCQRALYSGGRRCCRSFRVLSLTLGGWSLFARISTETHCRWHSHMLPMLHRVPRAAKTDQVRAGHIGNILFSNAPCAFTHSSAYSVIVFVLFCCGSGVSLSGTQLLAAQATTTPEMNDMCARSRHTNSFRRSAIEGIPANKTTKRRKDAHPSTKHRVLCTAGSAFGHNTRTYATQCAL